MHFQRYFVFYEMQKSCLYVLSDSIIVPIYVRITANITAMFTNENGTVSPSQWQSTMRSTFSVSSTDTLGKVKNKLIYITIECNLFIQSVASLEKMNQMRPDDRTLEELFQKTIVTDVFLFSSFDIYLSMIGCNGFTTR
jgi:hypothetical protein